MKTLRAMPILQISDMDQSLAFYARAGFAAKSWADAAGTASFSLLQRGSVTLGLQLHRTEGLPACPDWAAYIYVSDIEACHTEFTEAGLAPTAIRRPEHYACAELEITDPDGHTLAFGQDLDPGPGPGLGTDEGKG